MMMIYLLYVCVGTYVYVHAYVWVLLCVCMCVRACIHVWAVWWVGGYVGVHGLCVHVLCGRSLGFEHINIFKSSAQNIENKISSQMSQEK